MAILDKVKVRLIFEVGLVQRLLYLAWKENLTPQIICLIFDLSFEQILIYIYPGIGGLSTNLGIYCELSSLLNQVLARVSTVHDARFTYTFMYANGCLITPCSADGTHTFSLKEFL